MSIRRKFIFLILALTLSFNSSSSSSVRKFVTDSTLGVYQKAAVTSNGWECAQIGADILKKGGSAVDAAIATLICEGVSAFPSMGLGGGFTMVIYDAKTKKTEFLNARDMAPAAATEDMFQRNASMSYSGGLSIAVPGELRGYWEAHQKYGKLPWKDLFKPSIKLCATGANVTATIESQLGGVEDYIRRDKILSDFLIDPNTNELIKKNYKVKRPKLIKTLRSLANAKNPVKLFYEGRIANALVRDIQAYGGIITKEDFKNYKVKWGTPITAKLGNYTMLASQPPGSGALLVFLMKVLDGLVQGVEDENIFWQRIIETFKWTFARRSELGDPDKLGVKVDRFLEEILSDEYINEIRQQIKDDVTYNDPRHYKAQYENIEDHGTGQVSVVAPDGSAVAVTATINQILGSKIMSSTGIILNNQMDDFSSPGITNGYGLSPAPNNFVLPGKRPLSSTSPTILLDGDDKVRMVIGAAGGSRITTSVAVTMIHNLYRGYNIKEAIDVRRLHHQLLPMEVSFEEGSPPEVLDYLQSIGHNLTPHIIMRSSVTAISVENGTVYANGDGRKDARTAGF